MKITNIRDYKESFKAVSFIRSYFAKEGFELADFRDLLLQNTEKKLPQAYIIEENDEKIGFIILAANDADSLDKTFKFLGVHNGDALDEEKHKEILKYAIAQCDEYNAPDLKEILRNELEGATKFWQDKREMEEILPQPKKKLIVPEKKLILPGQENKGGGKLII
ncbi:MAG: hypothetical protein IJF98_01075 [Firmicutes bacterium]|nr:hypothetical protein [Bacillota bacterium]